MVIFFLRHASAGKKRSNPKQDEKRPLDKDGIDQCREVGRALAALDIQVDVIISSPLKRATQTAALVANELGYEGNLKLDSALRPEAGYEQFQALL
ncbi:MAG TPA: phosphoglycerate mutase family protein, partial [Terriglobales bacterium]|nr:phosphoglycerate mutase family protein [Terriglobales bacterium]